MTKTAISHELVTLMNPKFRGNDDSEKIWY